MQWNTTNFTKEEIRKKQEEYIKAAIEMSKKAKPEVDITISEPVIINIPSNKQKDEKEVEFTQESNPIIKNNLKKTDIEAISDVFENIETSDEIEPRDETTDAISDSNKANITTNAIKESESESDEIIASAEEIFANVFMTEEEAEEKLKEAEKTIEEFSKEIPDFNKYIEMHNKENSTTNSTGNADE